MSAQLYWIGVCLAAIFYGILSIRYGLGDWPHRMRWALNGIIVIIAAFMALLWGALFFRCV